MLQGRFESMMSELELFKPQMVNGNIESNKTIAYFPLAPLVTGSPIEFYIPGGEGYLDLANLLLKVRIRVVKESQNANVVIPDAETKVSLTNMPLHSLFAQIDAYFNDTLVQSSSNTSYPYIAYLSTVLGYNSDSKNSYKTSEGYFEDNPFNPAIAWDANHIDLKTNGIVTRGKLIAKSKAREFYGRLHIDCAKLNKFLLNGVSLRLRLLPNSDKFSIISNEAAANIYHVEFQEAVLYARHMIVNPNLALAHARMLQNQHAIYDVTQTVLRTYTIGSGLSDTTKENLFLGKLPNRLLIGLVRNSAFNGDQSLNPFNFEHFNLSYLQISVDHQNIPEIPLTPNYNLELYARSYITLFSELNQLGGNNSNQISYEQYPKGYALYAFDLTKEHRGDSENLSLPRTGSLRIVMKFATPLQHIVNVVCLGEFENQIYINRNREVTYIIE